jgi:hypothetical protein
MVMGAVRLGGLLAGAQAMAHAARGMLAAAALTRRGGLAGFLGLAALLTVAADFFLAVATGCLLAAFFLATGASPGGNHGGRPAQCAHRPYRHPESLAVVEKLGFPTSGSFIAEWRNKGAEIASIPS